MWQRKIFEKYAKVTTKTNNPILQLPLTFDYLPPVQYKAGQKFYGLAAKYGST